MVQFSGQSKKNGRFSSAKANEYSVFALYRKMNSKLHHIYPSEDEFTSIRTYLVSYHLYPYLELYKPLQVKSFWLTCSVRPNTK